MTQMADAPAAERAEYRAPARPAVTPRLPRVLCGRRPTKGRPWEDHDRDQYRAPPRGHRGAVLTSISTRKGNASTWARHRRRKPPPPTYDVLIGEGEIARTGEPTAGRALHRAPPISTESGRLSCRSRPGARRAFRLATRLHAQCGRARTHVMIAPMAVDAPPSLISHPSTPWRPERQSWSRLQLRVFGSRPVASSSRR